MRRLFIAEKPSLALAIASQLPGELVKRHGFYEVGDDVVTYSFEAQATSSDLGLIVADTPVAGSDPVTSVSVTPASASIAVGATVTLTATAAPGTADQRVTWSSADGAIATVSSTGVVTGVAAGGPVLIIATSVDDPTKTDTSSITVTL